MDQTKFTCMRKTTVCYKWQMSTTRSLVCVINISIKISFINYYFNNKLIPNIKSLHDFPRKFFSTLKHSSIKTFNNIYIHTHTHTHFYNTIWLLNMMYRHNCIDFNFKYLYPFVTVLSFNLNKHSAYPATSLYKWTVMDSTLIFTDILYFTIH